MIPISNIHYIVMILITIIITFSMSYLKLPQLNLMTPILARDSTCSSVRGNKTEYKNSGIEYCSSRQPQSN